MKEQEVINKLKLLKTIQPNQRVLKDIKQNVYQQVYAENKIKTTSGFQELFGYISNFIKSYTVVSYGFAFTALLIIFLSVSSVLLPDQFHTAIVNGRIALASSHYQKARIALTDTKSRFEKNKTIETNTQEFSHSLALTNTQLNNLHLKGEKGKYSAQQCRQIYLEYLNFLKKEEKNINAKNNPSYSHLKSQINTYKEQAEKKLHMYNSL